jgi:hypothetical protein
MRSLQPARLLAPAALLAAGLVLAACSSSAAPTTTTTRPRATTTSTSTSTTTTTTVAGTTLPSSTSSTTTTTAPAPPCAGSALGVSRNAFTGAAGQLSVGFAVLNKGSSTCSITGYPVLFLDGSGSPVEVTSHTGEGPAFQIAARPVVLAPGDSSGFVYEYSDVQSNGSQCLSASSISVTLPASGSKATKIAYKAFPCGSPGSVSAIVTASQEHDQFS